MFPICCKILSKTNFESLEQLYSYKTMDLTHLFNLQTACFRHAQKRISVVLNLKSCLSSYFQPNLSAFVRLWVNINSAKQNQNTIWLNKFALCCCSSFVDYSLLIVGYCFPMNAQRSFFCLFVREYDISLCEWNYGYYNPWSHCFSFEPLISHIHVQFIN